MPTSLLICRNCQCKQRTMAYLGQTNVSSNGQPSGTIPPALRFPQRWPRAGRACPLGEGLKLRLCYLPLTHWEAPAEMTLLLGPLQGPSWCSEGQETGPGSGRKSSPLPGAGIPSYSGGKAAQRQRALQGPRLLGAQLLLCSNPSSSSPPTPASSPPGLPGGWGSPAP